MFFKNIRFFCLPAFCPGFTLLIPLLKIIIVPKDCIVTVTADCTVI